MSYSLVLQVVENSDPYEDEPAVGILGPTLILDADMKKDGAHSLYTSVIETLIEKGFIF